MDKRNYNIIGLAGRKESGKTALANICTEYGYTKISFATALKNLACEILHFSSIDELNSFKNKAVGHIWSEEDSKKIAVSTGIPYDLFKEIVNKFTPQTTGRDYLQIIGTDIIRQYKPQWHVLKLLSQLEPDKKYVIDDVRFPNELEALQHKNADCWFIARMKLDNISHHNSEESLSLLDCGPNIIVNDKALDDLTSIWRKYLEGPSDFQEKRINMLKEYKNGFKCESLFIYPQLWKMATEFMECKGLVMNCLAVSVKDNAIVLRTNDKPYHDVIRDPFKIELLKKYVNLRPND